MTKKTMKKLAALTAALTVAVSAMSMGASAATEYVGKEITFEPGTTFTISNQSADADVSQVGVTNEADCTVYAEAESASNANVVLHMPAGTTVKNYRLANTNSYKVRKIKADFNLSAMDENTTVKLADYHPQYTYHVANNHIAITNGAVYAKDVDVTTEGLAEKAPAGTIAANKWYTLERWLDVRDQWTNEAGNIRINRKERVVITDKEAGTAVVDTGWIYAGEVSGYNNNTDDFQTVFFAADANSSMMLDNLGYYGYGNLPTVTYAPAGNDTSVNNYMVMPTETMPDIAILYGSPRWQNATPILNVLKSTTHNWAVKVNFNTLPSFDVNILSFSADMDANNATKGLMTKAFVVNGSNLYFQQYNDSTSTWTKTLIEDVTIEAGKWYTFKETYYGYILPKAGTYKWNANTIITDDKANETTSTADFVVECDGQTIYSKTGETVKKINRGTDKYNQGLLSLSYIGASQSAAVTIDAKVDDIHASSSYDNGDGTATTVVWINADFEEYNADTDFGTVKTTERNKLASHANRDLYTLNYCMNTKVWEDCVLDEGMTSSVVPSAIKLNFSSAMDVNTVTKENIRISSIDNSSEIIPNYEVVPAEDGLSCVINFTKPLDYETLYTITLTDDLYDTFGIPMMVEGTRIEYALTTGAASDDDFGVVSLAIVDAEGAEYTNASLAEGDVIKASATIKNIGPDAAASIILAVYDGNKLADVKINNATVKSSLTEAEYSTLTYTAEKSGLTAKAFVWNSLTGMKSLAAIDVLGE